MGPEANGSNGDAQLDGGSHFHGWIDYNGVSHSIELLERVGHFRDFGSKKILTVMIRFSALLPISAPFQISAPLRMCFCAPILISAPILIP